MVENRVLRKIFGPKRDEITMEWSRLPDEELNDLCFSPNFMRMIKSGRMGWNGHVARMEERRGVYRGLVGKLEGERPLGRPGRRCKDNIKIDPKEVGWQCVGWIDLAWDRDKWQAFVNAVMNLWVP